MITILQSRVFRQWLLGLRDRTARARIITRILRLESGNPGDAKSLSGAVVELRIHFGPGYRVYYSNQGSTIVILLCGGDKSSQPEDIRHATEMAANLDPEELEPWR